MAQSSGLKVGSPDCFCKGQMLTNALDSPDHQEQHQLLQELKPQLAALMASLRAVWGKGGHFAASENMSSLLQKASNDVMRCCCKAVDPLAIFSSAVDSVVSALDMARPEPLQLSYDLNPTPKTQNPQHIMWFQLASDTKKLLSHDADLTTSTLKESSQIPSC